MFFNEVHRRACSQSLDIFVEEIEWKERESHDLTTNVSNLKGTKTTRALDAEKREKWSKRLYIQAWQNLQYSPLFGFIPTAGILGIVLGIFSFILYKIFHYEKQMQSCTENLRHFIRMLRLHYSLYKAFPASVREHDQLPETFQGSSTKAIVQGKIENTKMLTVLTDNIIDQNHFGKHNKDIII